VAEEFELKRITRDGLEAATQRAEHYRLLNQPELAESICHDVLALDPGNQRALVALILALTDQFGAGRSSAKQAREHVDRLKDEYQRTYYAGVISERQARALLGRGPAAAFAYDGFREAMEWFEKAAMIRPAGNDDALLRWNTCARTIRDRNLRPRPDERESQLE
jgi:tetratricopeptide (TPR) repeat protein